MEDGLRVDYVESEGQNLIVLILVLVEDGLREIRRFTSLAIIN